MITVNWYGQKVDSLLDIKRLKFLRAAGNLGVNQAGEMAHKITGTLANSITYKLFSGGGSAFKTRWGKGVPPQSAKVSQPKMDRVRIGSALVYAIPQERHNGWLSKARDAIQRGTLELLAKRIFRI